MATRPIRSTTSLLEFAAGRYFGYRSPGAQYPASTMGFVVEDLSWRYVRDRQFDRAIVRWTGYRRARRRVERSPVATGPSPSGRSARRCGTHGGCGHDARSSPTTVSARRLEEENRRRDRRVRGEAGQSTGAENTLVHHGGGALALACWKGQSTGAENTLVHPLPHSRGAEGRFTAASVSDRFFVC